MATEWQIGPFTEIQEDQAWEGLRCIEFEGPVGHEQLDIQG